MRKGLNINMLMQVVNALGMSEKKNELIFLLNHLYDCFVQRDAEIIEINPLVYTKDKRIVAADTKVIIDDNALFRQADLLAEEDRTQANYKESIAHSYDLQYICTQGNIGVLANGAGLAMASMDCIKYFGGEPANFLDIGGTATHEQIMEAIKLLETDEEITAIYINIFGGITSCDRIASSIIKTAEEINAKTPIVMRLKGNSADSARNMIINRKDNLKIYFEEEMDKAA